MSDLKVLLITYYWPPSGGGGVHRWLKMSRYFPDCNIDLHIYTPSNPEYPAYDPSLVNEIDDRLTIIKHSIREPYAIYKKFTGKNKKEGVYSGFINEKKSLAQSLSVWIRGNLFIPDARMLWINPSRRYLKKLQVNNNFDVIISTGPPHSMHMIAHGVKKEFPQIKWIADFRDPWTNIDFYDQLKLTSWADRRHRRMEQLVLSQADRIVTVGFTMAKELEALGADHVDVITNGFDPLDFEESVELDPQFTIMHLGSMNKDRNPNVLWKSLSQLRKEEFYPKVRIIGKTDVSVKNSLAEFGVSDQVELEDFIPHSEAVVVMQSAHVLLLVINNTPNAAGILTGKVFEYLGSKRPILAIGPEKGDVKDLLHPFNHAYYISYGEVDQCTQIIKKLMKNNAPADVEGIEQYSRKQLAIEYCELIEEVCR
ncbi:glycosyltransferase [Portibacter marinus]|uniref:glycosyltransferase n=1 Tax=Portibacter marinus TaxID=2898660 RepID=UPI001F159A8C|nr:glycosyltransferase [Portibacter marinus]